MYIPYNSLQTCMLGIEIIHNMFDLECSFMLSKMQQHQLTGTWTHGNDKVFQK